MLHSLSVLLTLRLRCISQKSFSKGVEMLLVVHVICWWCGFVYVQKRKQIFIIFCLFKDRIRVGSKCHVVCETVWIR